MRRNVINNDYIMISADEITKRFFNSNDSKRSYFKKLFLIKSQYEMQKKKYIDTLAISVHSSYGKSIMKIYDDNISLIQLQNALLYAIIFEKEEKNILTELVKSRKILSYKEIYEKYGQNIAMFIISNGDYNYSSNFNAVKQTDETIYLIDDDSNIKKLNLLQNDELKLRLENKD